MSTSASHRLTQYRFEMIPADSAQAEICHKICAAVPTASVQQESEQKSGPDKHQRPSQRATALRNPGNPRFSTSRRTDVQLNSKRTRKWIS